MKFTYHIEGMHCQSCSEKIKSALSPVVKVIDVTLNPPLLHVEADVPPSLDELNKTLATIGKYRLSTNNIIQPSKIEEKGLRVYYPIFLITAYIVGVAFINNFYSQGVNWGN